MAYAWKTINENFDRSLEITKIKWKNSGRFEGWFVELPNINVDNGTSWNYWGSNNAEKGYPTENRFDCNAKHFSNRYYNFYDEKWEQQIHTTLVDGAYIFDCPVTLYWGGKMSSYNYSAAANCFEVYVLKSTFAPSSYSVNFQGIGGTYNLVITGDATWTASTNDSWITLSAYSGNIGNTNINLYASRNSTGADRNGTVTFTDNDGYVFTITVNQLQLVESIPVNKYKLGTSNIQKTYEGSTQINKMYVGNDLVYRALHTTTGPQLQMPLNEVWYKTTNNNSIGFRSGTYYIDSNGNQLTYTQSFDSVSGLWKMVFSDDVYGCQGPVYYNSDDRLVEVWYPYGYVKPNPMFAYGQTHLEKFKGDSPAIVDNGNAILCLVDCNVDGVNGKNFVMQAVTSGAATINIPEGALGLGPYTFFKATATTINLPSTITYVGNYCFERTNLTTLNCYATTVPTTFSNIWYAVGNSGTLHYPTGSDYSSFPVPSGWTKVGDL